MSIYNAIPQIASNPVPSSPYVHWKMHDQAAAGANVLVESTGTVQDMTLSGTPDWTTNAGYLTFDTAAGGSVAQLLAGNTTSAEKAIVEAHSNPGQVGYLPHQYLLSVWLNLADQDWLTSSTIFQNGASIDGTYLRVLSNAGKTVKFQWASGGTGEAISSLSHTVTANDVHVFCYLDADGGSKGIYIDGVLASSGTLNLRTSELGSYSQIMVGTSSNYSAVLEKIFAVGEVSAPLMSDLVIIKTLTDVSSQINDLAVAMGKSRTDFPPMITGI